MEKEILEWLEEMAIDEKSISTLEKAAATLQFWRESGVYPPESLTSAKLLGYCTTKVAEKAKVLKTYRVIISTRLATTLVVEAHSNSEAEDIAYEYAYRNEARITESMWDGASGDGFDFSPAYEAIDDPDVYYDEAVEAGYVSRKN